MLWLDATFPYSFFGFGHPIAKGSYKSYLIRDPDRAGFEVWATNRWSAFCLSYEKENGHLRIVKVWNVTQVLLAVRLLLGWQSVELRQSRS